MLRVNISFMLVASGCGIETVADTLRILADRLVVLGDMQRLPIAIFDRSGAIIGDCHLSIV